jgi:peptidoglycan/xylan/chitin deacetylase (PgdA/CDA1 family)
MSAVLTQCFDAPEAALARDTIHRRLAPESGRCYLTFDDGPDPRWTPEVLEALAEARVTATFFVVGRLAASHAALVRATRAAGHVVACHSFSHRHAWLLTPASARREVLDGANAVADVLGERPQWYRPPHGRLSRTIREAAQEAGLRVALWSVSAIDWGPFASPARIRSRLRMLSAGDIVLLHDGPLRHNRPDQTLHVLPDVLAGLAKHGPPPAPLPTVATMAA